MATDLAELERRLWAAADELRANSKLTAHEYRDPVLGLIFLAFAEERFDAARAEVEASGGKRRKPGPENYQARGVLYVSEEARLSTIASAEEAADIGQLVNDAITGNRGLLVFPLYDRDLQVRSHFYWQRGFASLEASA